MQFRHILEVHTIYPGDKRKRDKDRTDNREQAHDIIEAVADFRLVERFGARDHFAVIIHGIENLGDVIGHIAEIYPVAIVNPVGFQVVEAIERVAQRQESVSDLGDQAFQFEDTGFAVGGSALGMEFVFNVQQQPVHIIHHIVVVVHNGINNRIGQVIRTFFSQPADAFCHAGMQRSERIVFVFLEREDKAAAGKYGDLFGVQFLLFRFKADIVQDEEQAVVVLLQFGALLRIEYVFEDERVDLKVLSDAFDLRGVRERPDVNPDDFFFIRHRTYGVAFFCFKARVAVADRSDRCAALRAVAGVH